MHLIESSKSKYLATAGIILASAAIVLAGLACQPVAGGAGQSAETPIHTMVHDGRERTYRILQSDEPAASPALVLGLHGGGGDGDQFCSLGGGVSELIEERGFLMVCPDAVEGHWNDGREIDTYQAHREHVDDVGFLVALIERVTAEYGADPGRVYVTGASNGGMMTYRMACAAPESISAAATLIANMPADLDCNPPEPTPILIINGTHDPLMPFAGGSVTFLRREMGTVLSTHATVEFWAASNGCEAGPIQEAVADRVARDGSIIIRRAYAECDQGARVVLYEVQGGGHTVPGGQQYAPRWLIGTVNRDLHAGRLVWDFFLSHD